MENNQNFENEEVYYIFYEKGKETINLRKKNKLSSYKSNPKFIVHFCKQGMLDHCFCPCLPFLLNFNIFLVKKCYFELK